MKVNTAPTGAAALASYIAECDQARALGCKVVAVTVGDRNGLFGPGITHAFYRTNVDILNAGIRAASSHYAGRRRGDSPDRRRWRGEQRDLFYRGRCSLLRRRPNHPAGRLPRGVHDVPRGRLRTHAPPIHHRRDPAAVRLLRHRLPRVRARARPGVRDHVPRHRPERAAPSVLRRLCLRDAGRDGQPLCAG